MKKYDLGKENINKLLFAFALPCVISSLINSIYNIVDQIFIGKGVGTLGNAATNVLFPLIIILSAISGLIGNGGAANLSLKLGEGNKEEAAKTIGNVITLTFIISIILTVLSYILLPNMIYWFGSTTSVYPYALEYGKIIVLGIPFLVAYSSINNIIRADGSPKYSMIMLVVGAIINIILDPIFIFGYNMGVKGGAIATVIGEFISFILAIIYLFKIKSVKLQKHHFKLDKNIFKILSLGLSSFITQATVLVLFIFMNNMMTKLGAKSEFGADIPLSVYGIISKVNSIYISIVIGISIGAGPIVGFNYGAMNKDRVKEVLKKVLLINLSIGLFINIIFILFPKEIASIFITKTDPNYILFIKFAKLMCHTFLLVCGINALEMTTSVLLQSLGKVFKATILAFTRQIILLIPLSLLLSIVLNKGIYGILYAGLISDIMTFILAIFIFYSEYKLLSFKEENNQIDDINNKNNNYKGKHIVITISREYGSGGRFVGKLLADKIGINFYDKELISLTAKETGLSKEYIKEEDEKKNNINNDELIYLAEANVIKKLYKQESCVIVGRCADYILKDCKDVIKIFLYSDMSSKIKRAVKYYGIAKDIAEKEIIKINKQRGKHYKHFTGRNWQNFENYDFSINVDNLGVEATAKMIKNILDYKNTEK